jgi:hypothetical protein
MSLRLRRWLARGFVAGGFVAALGALTFVVFARHMDALLVSVPTAVGAVLCGVCVDAWLVRHAKKRLNTALESQSVAEARQRYLDLAGALGRRWTETTDACFPLSTILILEHD